MAIESLVSQTFLVAEEQDSTFVILILPLFFSKAYKILQNFAITIAFSKTFASVSNESSPILVTRKIKKYTKNFGYFVQKQQQDGKQEKKQKRLLQCLLRYTPS